jgi:hypothetical protein
LRRADKREHIQRTKIVGGWLVLVNANAFNFVGVSSSMTFVPDPKHEWDGRSLP